MTDAALAVTERAVERFTEAYLKSLGAEIAKEGRRWTVSLPEDAPTDLELDGAVLEITDDPNGVGEDTLAITPESPFVERMLDEAADHTPTGSLALTGERVDIQLPPWLVDGSVDVLDQTFTPYYDRQAICALFHVGIETVSEYQREDLHAVAIDLNDHEERPGLADTYLELTDDEQPELDEGKGIDEQELMDALNIAHTTLENELSSTVRDTRERATRAAEVELDEYRQYVRQRREELADEIDSLTTRIEDVTETIDTASKQEERVEALRKRKEFQAELDGLRDELDDLTTQIETDFPEKRREIRERHGLTVRLRPVAATVVAYERGDLELTLRKGEKPITRSYGYGVGAGIMEDVTCERCGQRLTAENVLTVDGNQAIGTKCCGGQP
ncbi:hypothetical protein [Halorhabdus sp. CUG00001]|uniref:hypothetical protein n=1 Tax=Halorhabdus sp. CUG00001 TaxID=2600297 RepID=UPI00131E89C5|nr:hypothetical protein [Halorhabdus sp. CUG00001]